MSTVVKEHIESRDMKYQDGRLVGSRRFHVYDNASDTTLTTPDLIVALFGTASTPDQCPAVGHPHPNNPTLFASTWSLDKVPDFKNLWLLVWSYEENVVTNPPGSIGYVEFSMSRRREFDDIWRTSPNITIAGDNGVVSNSNATDIIGVPSDIAGEPVSRLRLKQRLEFSEIVTLQNWEEYATLGSSIVAHVGKRNATAFYGAAKGRLLFEGAEDTRVGLNKFRFTYHFLWDQWYHLVQLPKRGPAGTVLLDVDRRALEVYWRQPFTELSEFNGTNGLGVYF